MTTVGIPRALLYYQYYPMWKTFFDRLGANIMVSSPTSKKALAAGAARVVAETCLPVKAFCGHVLELRDMRCDYVFVPSIRSIDTSAYNCSKFLGLPDIVKAVIPDCPPVIEPDIDINKGKKELFTSIYATARKFTWNPLRVKEAAEAAWQVHENYQRLLRFGKMALPEALEAITGDSQRGPHDSKEARPSTEFNATVAVIGHPYMVYDSYINHKLIERLQNLGVRVWTAEMATTEELDAGIKRLIGKAYWTYEDEITGAGGHYLASDVDGVISITAFGCGPDSVMIDVIQRSSKKGNGKPFMSLTIDEHAAEAGLVTRLEAFMDILRRRKRRLAAVNY